MRRFLLFTFLVYLNSISAQLDTPIDGDITNESCYVEIGLYAIGDPLTEEHVKEQYLKAFQKLKVVQDIPGKVTENSIAFYQYNNAQKDYAPGDLEYLKYFAEGLNDRQKQVLTKSNQASVFLLFGLKKDAWALNKKLTEWVYNISKNKKWIIYDGETRQYFTPESWFKNRLESWTEDLPYIPDQISIHSYRDGEFCRSITLGMQKFCLPDIVINDVSCYNIDSYVYLTNVLAQQISSTPIIYKNQLLIDLDKISNQQLREEVALTTKENAKKKTILYVKNGKWEEGDPYNPLLEINFENDNYETPQLYQENLTAELFGFEDEISYVNHNDEILAASEAAKKKLPGLKEIFNKGLEPGSTLLLKAPFEDDEGGSEWMWVEVTEWKTSKIHGILQNEPFKIKSLKTGSEVTANQKDIFDYIFYKPDGTMEGNTTGELIMKYQNN